MDLAGSSSSPSFPSGDKRDVFLVYTHHLELLQGAISSDTLIEQNIGGRKFLAKQTIVDTESGVSMIYGMDKEIFTLLNERFMYSEQQLASKLQQILNFLVPLLSQQLPQGLSLLPDGTFSQMINNDLYDYGPEPEEDLDEFDEDEEEDEMEQSYSYSSPSSSVQNSAIPKQNVSFKGPCKYGINCYRTNPDHLAEYYHPLKSNDPPKQLVKNPFKAFDPNNNSQLPIQSQPQSQPIAPIYNSRSPYVNNLANQPRSQPQPQPQISPFQSNNLNQNNNLKRTDSLEGVVPTRK